MATGNVRYAAERGSELSCGHATGTDTMPEAVTVGGPPVAKGTASVSAPALAQHLDCSRAYIGKLEAEGVIQRQGDGFPLDQSRVAYLRYLRRERRQSPRSEADAEHVKAKTQMLQLRLMEKRRELVRRDGCSDRPARWHNADASIRYGGPVLARYAGEAQYRRGRGSGPTRHGGSRP